MARKNIFTRKRLQKAHTLLERGDFQQADELLMQLLERTPNQPEAWFLLGAIKGQFEDHAASERFSRKAVSLRPGYTDAWYNLGNALQAQGRYKEAVEAYGEAIRLKPDFAEAMVMLANGLDELGRVKEAIGCLKRSIAIKPSFTEAYVNLGVIYASLGQNDDAIQAYHTSLTLRPDMVDASFRLSGLLANRGLIEEGKKVLRQSPGYRRDDPILVAGEANLFEKQGDYQGAYQRLKPLLEREVANTAVALTFGRLSQRIGKQAEGVRCLEQVLQIQHIPRDQQVNLHFALGKLYDKAGEFDSAFKQFQAGNRLRRRYGKEFGFDRERHRQLVSALISTFSHTRMERYPQAKPGTRTPIFIVGMPRSGTSLAEQIIASHPQVYGAGELEELKLISQRLSDMDGVESAYPAAISEITPRQFDEIAGVYHRNLDKIADNSDFVTDKMPANFIHLGLIQLLFPDCRVIHCMRNPLDTMLSGYFQNFSSGLAYTYDLDDLVFYYREYRRLMAHWREALNIPMLELQYEELVNSQESKSRELIDFCGLSWDERCLEFHTSKRQVGTASYDQVKQPIYKSSINRWENYRDHIGPLLEALEGQ